MSRDPSTVRVLVGCETSGAVRRAFAARGFDAWSCDILPSDDGSNKHLQMDIREAVEDFGPWDLLTVMHPPCTRLCNSGVRWLHKPPNGKTLEQMWADLDEGAELFSYCLNADIKHKAVENPQMHKYAKERIINYIKPQIVQPWWFGDKAFKATGLHLIELPELMPTDKLTPPKTGTEEHKLWSAIHRAPPGPDRWKIRSATFPGIANAMATQWGQYLCNAQTPKDKAA